MSAPRPWVYSFVRSVLFIGYKAVFSFRFFASEKVPAASYERGVILASNHASFLDPPILGISVKRHVTYLAKEYLFKPLFLGWLLRSVGALPIKTQSDDFKSIRQLIRILKNRGCIVVFPEGTRSPDGALREAEVGVGFLAIKSGAVVVPVYIRGSYEAFPRQKKMFTPKPVSVYYGDPFVPALDKDILSNPDPYKAVGQRIMAEIKILKEKNS